MTIRNITAAALATFLGLSMTIQANAMTELNMTTAESSVDSLAAKDDAAPDAAVKDELEAMKAKLGLTATS